MQVFPGGTVFATGGRSFLLAALIVTMPGQAAVPEPPPPAAESSGAEAPVPKILNLRTALALSLRHNPRLNAATWEIQVREARRIRAGLLPNPRLRIAVEDFGGSGSHRGYNVAETTLMLSQLIELGGKRGKRHRLASSERDLAIWDYEARRLQTALSTRQAFIEVLAAQEELALSQRMEALAERLYATVDARVRAGEVSRLQRYKARVELAQARLASAEARTRLADARQRLAASWGDLVPRFDRAVGDLSRLASLPPLETLVARLAQNPDVARWATEMVRRQRQLELARALTIPDLTVRGGVRQYAENGDVAAVAVFQVPLFLFNDQRTQVTEARAGLGQAEQRRRAALVEARRQLVAAYQRWRRADVQARLLRDEVLPNAEAAFTAIRDAYRLGKVGVLDLIDAQRTLFTARRRQLAAWMAWHLWQAAVERLLGSLPQDSTLPVHEASS
ncbi:outer membrane protein, heavy metal efflux system [Methylomarinovum tepidoasis]|uniref:Outer membrane protein, heavy metal efflux system n=1 Tax=Methylomarinovum tepidoasis TaxID=2840183 RepID=A0AAU9C8U0_9GAMM|nr:TolC family protein [Methylomarinovum sp. IN45]BCX88277.1 outer membrane protein, heavy metal efflux system [Methylomarinovum sp. IN45]